jgi:hypothetical protein
MMKLTAIPILGAALAALLFSSTRAAIDQHAPQIVRVTLRDGTVRTAKLKGVGCPIAVCSRVAFKGVQQDHSIVPQDFEKLGVIRDITTHAASFIARDGSKKRLTLLYDFRILYLEGSPGEERRIDLGEVESVEFSGAAR